MAEKVKRLNYFNGQFLNAKDFSDEQTYHSFMRQEHSRLLHTWGIANGLLLSADKGAMQVKVSPGMGLDIHGREIVLADEDLTDDLTSFGGKSPLYITIAWNEIESDKSTVAGVNTATRMESKPIIKVATTQPTPGEALILGTVTVDAQGRVTDVDNSAALRRIAGAKGGDLSVVSLNLTGLNIDPSMQPRLTVTTAGRVDLQGSLRVNGNLDVTGNVGVGTTTPTVRLEVSGALKFTNTGSDPNDGRIGSGLFGAGLNIVGIKTDTTFRKITLWGAITQSQNDGTNTWAGINQFNGNVGIGAAPAVRLDVRGDARLQSLVFQDSNGAVLPDNWLGVANNIDAGKNKWLHIGGITDNTDGSGARRRIGLFADNIHLSGSVGIGITAPQAPLHVASDMVIGPFGVGRAEGRLVLSGGAAEIGFTRRDLKAWPTTAQAGDRWVWYSSTSAEANLWTEATGNLLAVSKTGDLTARGAIRTGNSDIYFTKTDHAHSGLGNPAGNAAIENANDYNALMILGRSDAPTRGGIGKKRVVKLYDYVEIAGDLFVNGRIGAAAGQGAVPTPEAHTSGWIGGIRTWDLEVEASGWVKNGVGTGARDLAEIYFSDVELEAGELVCLDPEADRIIRSQEADDGTVIGIVSTAPGFLLNSQLHCDPPADGKKGFPVALCGRVPCKVTDENGPIQRGDPLSASSTPGHAMRAEPMMVEGKPLHRPGTLVGKALEGHEKGQGVIEVFVTLR